MKNILLSVLFLLLPPGFLRAQAISINTDASNPDPSAILDVKSTDKGMLVPRMTTAQRTAIAAPAKGLLVFDTDTGGFWFYDGMAWTNLAGAGGMPATFIADTDGNTKVQTEKTPNEDAIRFDLGGTEYLVLRKNAGGAPRLELPNALSNTFVGQDAGSANTLGRYNTAGGEGSLYSNTTGNDNTAYGVHALHFNSIGGQNTANGKMALYSNTNGNSNTANGESALYINTTGSSNTADGGRALYSNIAGSGNTATGASALFSNTDGHYNTANGFVALSSNTTGNYNTANGSQALFFNNSGYENTAHGAFGLYWNSTGIHNTGNGVHALFFNATGSNNSAFGYSATFATDNLENTTCLGAYAGGVSNVSNRIEIGNTSVSWIGGQVDWSTYSDARIKTRVQENVPGLDFITRLRPVTYHLDIHRQNELCFRGKKAEGDWKEKYDIEQKQLTGFIAQEVEQAAKAAGYDFSGVEKARDEAGMYSVRYAAFVVPLVKAMQEQQVEIETLKTENAALKAQLQQITAALQSAGIGMEK